MTFGAKFRALRESRNLTQASCDEIFGLMRGTVSNWENGYAYPEEELSGRFISLAEMLGIGAKKIAGGSDFFDRCPQDMDKCCAIIFTSGTTGKSKGVMLTQNNLISNVEAVEYDAAPGVVVLSVLPNLQNPQVPYSPHIACLSLQAVYRWAGT